MENLEFAEKFALFYGDLRRIASSQLRHEAPGELSAEDLVHEVYLRLRTHHGLEKAGRLQFLRIAAMAIRRVLVDTARKRVAAKRGRAFESSPEGIRFNESPVGMPETSADREILALDDALKELERVSPIRAQVVETRFFGGFTAAESAELLKISEARVFREWRHARAWLAARVRTQEIGKQGKEVADKAEETRRAKYEHADDGSNATVVRVFFATDRKKISESATGGLYGSGRSQSGMLHFGECEVSIPKIHKKGKIESPSLLHLEFRPNPRKHIVLLKIEDQTEALFFDRLAKAVKKTDAGDVFVFVHGFNVSFEDAARRTGQMAFDLEFICAPILYSWPSNGRVEEYLRDETEVSWTAPHFQRFLILLSQYSEAKRVHIIAHSMGNRAVCDALKYFSNHGSREVKVNHLLLAAPDIDAETFEELADSLRKLSGRITLYESSNDKALKISRKIHRYPRAGEPLLVISGVDTIDASAIDTDFLGHAYFSDTWPLLADMYSLLFKDEPPQRRFGLVEMKHQLGRYHAFRS
jgi:RNA polymerase sigma factor (TIGR02999 family)